MEEDVSLTLKSARVVRVFLEDPARPRYLLELASRTLPAPMSVSTVYSALIKLRAAGWLTRVAEDIDPSAAGRPARVLYQLTPEAIPVARAALTAISEETRMRPPPVKDPVELLNQVLDDIDDIDAEEAVQRLIDGGFTRRGAERHVDGFWPGQDNGKARMITWGPLARVTYRGDLPCECEPPHGGTVAEAVPGGGHGAQVVTVEFDCGLYHDIPGDELNPEPEQE
jgi:PadR family transcriptional regulator PadR